MLMWGCDCLAMKQKNNEATYPRASLNERLEYHCIFLFSNYTVIAGKTPNEGV